MWISRGGKTNQRIGQALCDLGAVTDKKKIDLSYILTSRDALATTFMRSL